MDETVTPKKQNSKTMMYAVLILVVALIAFFVGRASVVSPATAGGNQQVAVAQPTQHKSINKTFSFPVRDQNNKVIANLSYTLDSADILSQIIVKGQPATAVKGKAFLVINLRLQNPSSQQIVVNTRDYVRLSVNKSSDLLAPDIHNDPVEIDPISTKLTRVGFAINTSDKNFVLNVGEINGDKTTVPLNF